MISYSLYWKEGTGKMDFLSLELRMIIGIVSMGGLVASLLSLVSKRQRSHNIRITKSILSNSGTDITGRTLSLYKNKEFFKMINAGEDLCNDDIKFELFDYCGSLDRMFYNNGGETNETSN